MSKIPGRLNALIGEPIEFGNGSPFVRVENLVIGQVSGLRWAREEIEGVDEEGQLSDGLAVFMRPRRGQGGLRQERNAK